MPIPIRSHLRTVLCLAWLVAAAAGLAGMAKYEQTAGSTGETPRHWPSETGIALDHSRATLLLFAHPKCPCTRASVEELNRLLTHCAGAVSTHVLFFAPQGASSDWIQNGLWESAKAIPGVTVETDPDGKTAQRFGAETSGYVVLYNSNGELLFKGGITAGRGHAGDNPGANAIVSLLSAREATTRQTRVFGCALLNPKSAFNPETSLCIKP